MMIDLIPQSAWNILGYVFYGFILILFFPGLIRICKYFFWPEKQNKEIKDHSDNRQDTRS